MKVSVQNQNSSRYYSDTALSLEFWGDICGLSTNAVTASFLADIYKSHGTGGLCNLNGNYVIAVSDKTSNKIYLINDRYGFKKCYYWQNKNKLIFSQDYSSICNHPEFKGEEDEQSLADFLYLGFVLDDRTFHQEVKLLPAGSILSFETGQLSIEKYWDYSFSPADNKHADEEEYLEEFLKRLQGSLNKRINGRKEIILPLSGGLDSRAIAGMISEYGYDGTVESFSYGNKHCYDVVYGEKIARTLGYNHTFLPINTDYLARYAEKFVALTDGTIDCLNSHMMLFHDIFQKSKSFNVFTGFLGDVLTGTNFNQKWQEFDEDQIIMQTFEIPNEHLEGLKNYLNRDIYERIIENTIPAIKKLFNKINHDDLFYKAHYLTLSQRQRRYVTFNIFCYEPLGTVLSPFTDNDFIDFVLQLPREYLMEQSLYRKMFIKYFPKVASVPWSKSGLPLNASWIRKGFHWRRERLNKNPLVQATIGRKYSRMNDSYLNTNEAIRTGSKDFIIRHISDNSFLSEYFDMNRVHQMLDDHMSGKNNEYRKITALLTLSVWHKLFVDGKGPKQ